MPGRTAKGPKTNAMRLLDQRGIAYIPYWYDDTLKSAQGVAQALGIAPADVYKTLVMLRNGSHPMLVMVPGDREIDPRVLAIELDTKSVRMATQVQAEALTGLQTGGIGALALTHKLFEVYLDRTALDRESILVNGGKRGLNLRVGVKELVALTGARIVDALG